LGLEALSRGAREAVFCERDPALAAALRANLARLRQDGRARVVADDALTALAGLSGPFDIVFLDPPFGAGLWSAAAAQLEARGLLGAQSLIYLEAPREAAPALPPNWIAHKQTRAGEVQAALYRRGAGLA
ncbi:RsmD family RNA methyltransferase, partial [Tahibacter caeni]|uniref:RsmD family RNA methyltransferase n=1 Tax=Tahibacter caeni TaxID=1453545 RepID=UPI00214868D7